MRPNNGKSRARYAISRIDNEAYHTHAWRVSLSRHGKRHVKNFADKKCGGKGRALQLAREYRDSLLRKYPPLSRKEFCSVLRCNNRSGVTGVYRYAKSYTLKNGSIKKSWYWEATWPTGKSEQAPVAFPVNKYGEQRARQLAFRARENELLGIEGVYWASERGAALASGFDGHEPVRAATPGALARGPMTASTPPLQQNHLQR
jgi:hypothetical protein